MRLFGRKAGRDAGSGVEGDQPETAGQGPGASPGAPDEPETVVGERSTALVHRARSLQSRITDVLAIGLMCALGFAALTWYYVHTLSHGSHALELAQRAARAQAQGDAPLPPLGRFTGPQLALPTPSASPAPSLAQKLLGPPPELPSPAAMAAWDRADALARMSSGRQAAEPVSASHRIPAFERQLAGPVFAQSSGPTSQADSEMPVSGTSTTEAGAPWAEPQSSGLRPVSDRAPQGDVLSELLRPSVTPAVEASVLPTQRFLLPKGAFLDCTLETAIDSTLPGMTTCVTATDTFSADGTVVLLERGTKLVGETRGQVEQGQARLFVLWTEARTPTGVVVPLDSPGTDALGRSGLAGKVDTHFWERFGAAILVSVIDGAVQAGTESTGNGGTVIVNPQGSEEVMTDVLKSTVDIPPTIVVSQGTRVEVLVARDVDFRSVYRLALARPVSRAGTSP
jgi:type IV secretion system protein VirB10